MYYNQFSFPFSVTVQWGGGGENVRLQNTARRQGKAGAYSGRLFGLRRPSRSSTRALLLKVDHATIFCKSRGHHEVSAVLGSSLQAFLANVQRLPLKQSFALPSNAKRDSGAMKRMCVCTDIYRHVQLWKDKSIPSLH